VEAWKKVGVGCQLASANSQPTGSQPPISRAAGRPFSPQRGRNVPLLLVISSDVIGLTLISRHHLEYFADVQFVPGGATLMFVRQSRRSARGPMSEPH
jgi:hypothetical protein